MWNKNGGIFFDVILAVMLSFNAFFTTHIMLRISMALRMRTVQFRDTKNANVYFWRVETSWQPNLLHLKPAFGSY